MASTSWTQRSTASSTIWNKNFRTYERYRRHGPQVRPGRYRTRRKKGRKIGCTNVWSYQGVEAARLSNRTRRHDCAHASADHLLSEQGQLLPFGGRTTRSNPKNRKPCRHGWTVPATRTDQVRRYRSSDPGRHRAAAQPEPIGIPKPRGTFGRNLTCGDQCRALQRIHRRPDISS